MEVQPSGEAARTRGLDLPAQLAPAHQGSSGTAVFPSWRLGGRADRLGGRSAAFRGPSPYPGGSSTWRVLPRTSRASASQGGRRRRPRSSPRSRSHPRTTPGTTRHPRTRRAQGRSAGRGERLRTGLRARAPHPTAELAGRGLPGAATFSARHQGSGSRRRAQLRAQLGEGGGQGPPRGVSVRTNVASRTGGRGGGPALPRLAAAPAGTPPAGPSYLRLPRRRAADTGPRGCSGQCREPRGRQRRPPPPPWAGSAPPRPARQSGAQLQGRFTPAASCGPAPPSRSLGSGLRPTGAVTETQMNVPQSTRSITGATQVCQPDTAAQSPSPPPGTGASLFSFPRG
ncbi:uncharacterized protein LOC144378480 isoform X2 [Ictidomys tridecemlineatus]